MAQKVILRILLMPVVAGISYEIIRLAGRSDNILVRILSAPGMLIQRMTTKEPDEGMAEVAIAAVEAVFDWRQYLYENFGYEVDESWMDDGASFYEDEEDGMAETEDWTADDEVPQYWETEGMEETEDTDEGKGTGREEDADSL